ncbi:MAG: hypothetical protein ACI9BW_003016, partial [Gammaproteobacteria bacterium]
GDSRSYFASPMIPFLIPTSTTLFMLNPLT